MHALEILDDLGVLSLAKSVQDLAAAPRRMYIRKIASDAATNKTHGNAAQTNHHRRKTQVEAETGTVRISEISDPIQMVSTAYMQTYHKFQTLFQPEGCSPQIFCFCRRSPNTVRSKSAHVLRAF